MVGSCCCCGVSGGASGSRSPLFLLMLACPAVCVVSSQGEEASVLAFYVFLWGLGIWGLCRIHNQVVHQLPCSVPY